MFYLKYHTYATVGAETTTTTITTTTLNITLINFAVYLAAMNTGYMFAIKFMYLQIYVTAI